MSIPQLIFALSYHFFFSNTFIHLNFLGELQTISLKFGNIWILHTEILEFGFYPINFESICILYLNVSEFIFYSLRFRGVWINCLKFWGV